MKAETQNLNEVMPKKFEVLKNGHKVFESNDCAKVYKYISEIAGTSISEALSSGGWQILENGKMRQ